MAGGVREGEAGPSRQILDASLALRKMLKQFQAVGVAERPCDPSEDFGKTLVLARAYHHAVTTSVRHQVRELLGDASFRADNILSTRAGL